MRLGTPPLPIQEVWEAFGGDDETNDALEEEKPMFKHCTGTCTVTAPSKWSWRSTTSFAKLKFSTVDHPVNSLMDWRAASTTIHLRNRSLHCRWRLLFMLWCWVPLLPWSSDGVEREARKRSTRSICCFLAALIATEVQTLVWTSFVS